MTVAESKIILVSYLSLKLLREESYFGIIKPLGFTSGLGLTKGSGFTIGCGFLVLPGKKTRQPIASSLFFMQNCIFVLSINLI